MDRLERDLYQIEEDENGNKRIHVFGYAYCCDDEAADGSVYRMLEFTFFYIPVGLTPEEFAQAYGRNVEHCKQYFSNYTQDGITELLDDYFPGSVSELAYEEITENTPCGYYIHP